MFKRCLLFVLLFVAIQLTACAVEPAPISSFYLLYSLYLYGWESPFSFPPLIRLGLPAFLHNYVKITTVIQYTILCVYLI